MKALLQKTWFRYLMVFAVALTLVAGWFRFGPNPDPEGSNLLVNSVLAAILIPSFMGRFKQYAKNVRNVVQDGNVKKAVINSSP